MRNATGTTWIFGLVISFTLIFAGFLVLALAYSKAYKLKNDATSIIEKYEGVTINDSLNGKGSIQIINQLLQNSNYKSKGNCQDGEYGVDDLNSITILPAQRSQKYFYCISYNVNQYCRTLFRITLFYDFNLPIFGQLHKYQVSGQTNEIYDAYFLNSKIAC